MILIVEDEPGILDFVDQGLALENLTVQTAMDGESGLARALEPAIELVILDLMLPKLSGQAVLGELQNRRPELPVIVLTARESIADRVAALDAGAVDYLVKPFSIDELAARVRAQLRASRRDGTVITFNALEVDLIKRRVSIGDQQVQLSLTECELLVYLMRHAGQVLSRTEILRDVWGYQHDPGTNVLDVYIGYVRRKFAAVKGAPLISTVRLRGYRLDWDIL